MLLTKNLKFEYPNGPNFEFPDIELDNNDDLLIVGESGIGKTTLLHLLGMLIRPSSGEVFLNSINLEMLSEKEKDNFRGKNIGIIFQKPRFIKSLSLIENIQAKLYFSRNEFILKDIDRVLENLDIVHLKNEKVFTLSEGQKQRLSIAIAIISEPELILADEPTSSLDDTNCEKVINLLKDTARIYQSNLVLITHDQRVKPMFKNILEL